MFTLLMVLVEIWHGRGQKQPVEYYLTEAGFLIERGYLVRNRDAMLYHYYRWALDAGEGGARRTAVAALTTELERLGESDLARAFLATRYYAQVAQDLEVSVPV